jgi:hypothetical protein
MVRMLNWNAAKRERGSERQVEFIKGGSVGPVKREVVSCVPAIHVKLAVAGPAGENPGMRALAVLLVAAALLMGAYYFYIKKLPITDEGTASTQAISLTGVRGDLLQIAQAERAYIAANGACATLAELTSSKTLAIAKSGRDGYSYAVECSGEYFSVSARHAPAPAGSSLRYPNLAIDQSIQVREVN